MMMANALPYFTHTKELDRGDTFRPGGLQMPLYSVARMHVAMIAKAFHTPAIGCTLVFNPFIASS